MKPTFESSSIDSTALRKQLYELRREGFKSVEPAKVPDLITIAARLTPDESDERRQLEVSIKLVIADLPKDQKVASLWFGIHPDTALKDRTEREEAAADARFVSVKAFRSHNQKPLIESIAQALLDRYEPSIEPSIEASQLEPDAAPERQSPYTNFARKLRRPENRSYKRRRFIVAPGLVAIGIALWATISLLEVKSDEIHPAYEVPPVGTVVSAEDGSVVTEPDKSPIGQLIQSPDEGSFRACNVTKVGDEGNCRFPPVRGPIAVEMGDTLWIGRSLREEGEVPLPFVTLIARRRWENNHSAAAEMVVEWPEVKRRGNERDSDKLIFEMPGEYGYVNLVYVPGSTELRGPSWHDFIAHLPDGIMEGGISLANLGPPVSCFECFDQYKRYVFFKAQLEGHHSYED